MDTDERLIAVNPIQPRRRGKRLHEVRIERVWATPEQALGVAAQAAALVGDWAAILMITAAWTGARWGELAGLRRHNTHLDDAAIVIDRHTGALHEVNGRLELGPPKTAESARTITLPPSSSTCSGHISTSTTIRMCSSPAKGNYSAGRTSPAAPCAQPPTATTTAPDPAPESTR